MPDPRWICWSGVTGMRVASSVGPALTGTIGVVPRSRRRASAISPQLLSGPPSMGTAHCSCLLGEGFTCGPPRARPRPVLRRPRAVLVGTPIVPSPSSGCWSWHIAIARSVPRCRRSSRSRGAANAAAADWWAGSVPARAASSVPFGSSPSVSPPSPTGLAPGCGSRRRSQSSPSCSTACPRPVSDVHAPAGDVRPIRAGYTGSGSRAPRTVRIVELAAHSRHPLRRRGSGPATSVPHCITSGTFSTPDDRADARPEPDAVTTSITRGSMRSTGTMMALSGNLLGLDQSRRRLDVSLAVRGRTVGLTHIPFYAGGRRVTSTMMSPIGKPDTIAKAPAVGRQHGCGGVDGRGGVGIAPQLKRPGARRRLCRDAPGDGVAVVAYASIAIQRATDRISPTTSTWSAWRAGRLTTQDSARVRYRHGPAALLHPPRR